MKTTKMAQYAALAANSSCRAALVSRLIAALNSSVKTISTPTALNVSRVFASCELVLGDEEDDSCTLVEVRRYIVTTGTTSRMKMTKVMRMLMSLSMRVEL